MSKKEWIITVFQSIVLGAAVITLIHFVIQWFRNCGAAWLMSL